MKPAGRRAALIVVVLIVLFGVVAFVHHRQQAAAAPGDTTAGAATSGDTSSGGGSDSGGASGGGKRGHKGGSGGADDAGGAAGGGSVTTPVQVQTVQAGNIAATVPVTGNISALQDLQLSAKASARVIYLAGLEGQDVKAGQVIIQQDDTDLKATVREDQATLAKDKAIIDSARESYQIQLVQVHQNVLNAQASLNAAQQSYHKYLGGNRPQDILQSEATTLQSQAAADIAKTTVDRDTALYAQGAIAKSQLDDDTATYKANAALLKKAQAAEGEEKEGYQKEDIASQKELVREQQANVANQLAAQRNVAVQKSAIESAQATYVQDQAKMAFDQQQVDYASIRTPVDGIIAARETVVGQMATAGTSLMRIVSLDKLYYLPTISETDFSSCKVGDKVRIKVDALPGQNFVGKIAALFPAADTTTRVFSTRVEIDNPLHLLRPGMFARGTLTTKVAKGAIIVPTAALVSSLTQQGFDANTSSDAPVAHGVQLPPQTLVVARADNTAEVRPVTLGIVTMDRAQVLSGVQAGEKIVTVGQQGLKTGDKISIPTLPAAAGDTSAGGAAGGHHHHRKDAAQ